jgi:hypothetical protein
MTYPAFVLKGSVLDLPDVNDPEALQSVTFTPNTRGQMVGVDGNLIRPKPQTFTLDSSGRLGGSAGIQLLANDSALNLDTPLQWSVQVNTSDRQPKPFWFVAPDDAETVFIGDVAAVPFLGAQAITRGPRGVDDVVVAGDALQFRLHGEDVGDPIPLWVTQLDGGQFGSAHDQSYVDGGQL